MVARLTRALSPPASRETGVGVKTGGRLPDARTSMGSVRVLTTPEESLRSLPSVTSNVTEVDPENSRLAVKLSVFSSTTSGLLSHPTEALTCFGSVMDTDLPGRVRM